MALQVSLSASPSPAPSPLRSPRASAASRTLCRAAVSMQPDQMRTRSAGGWGAGLVSRSRVSSAPSASRGDRVWTIRPVRSSLEIAGPSVGVVTEVNKDTFWPLVKAAGGKVVVLDMYTQWCGPCKVIAPKFQELSQKYVDVVFLKLDCNQENKPLAKELGIRVVPTFKILKDDKVIKEVTGAKFHDLVLAIEAARSS